MRDADYGIMTPKALICARRAESSSIKDSEQINSIGMDRWKRGCLLKAATTVAARELELLEDFIGFRLFR